MAIKSFNAIAGFSVGEVPANVILANGDITTSQVTSTGTITGGNLATAVQSQVQVQVLHVL